MDKEAMGRWEAKLISVFVVFILPYVCILAPHWVAPWILRKGRTGERILCYLVCFGGGMFLGTFFLDLAPEAREILDTTLLHPNEIVYPVTDLIIGCEFFFVLYLEKIVMRVNKRRMQRKERELQRCCIMYHAESVATGRVCRNCREGLKCAGYVNEGQTKDHSGDHDLVFNSRIAFHVKEIEDSTCFSSSSSSSSSSSASPQTRNTPTAPEENSEIHVDAAHDVVETEKKTAPVDATSVSSHDFRSLILIVILSMHHVLEGLAIGLSNTTLRVLVVVVALVCNESIVGFTLGLQFVRSGYSLRRMLATGACCSIMMPVGVGVGTVMTELRDQTADSKIAGGVVLAFACGTIVYITFFEILQEEIDPEDTSLGKVTGAALGFAVIALLMLTLLQEKGNKVESFAVEEATAVFHRNASA